MTPSLHSSVAAFPISDVLPASSQHYAEVVQAWEDAAPSGENRTQAAHSILHASKTNSFYLDLSGFSTLTSLPKLPAGLTELDLGECNRLTDPT